MSTALSQAEQETRVLIAEEQLAQSQRNHEAFLRNAHPSQLRACIRLRIILHLPSAGWTRGKSPVSYAGIGGSNPPPATITYAATR